MIKLRHQQPSLWHRGLAEDIEGLREPWMRLVDELLEDEQLVDTVYEAQGERHPQSRIRGRMQTPAEVLLRLLLLKEEDSHMLSKEAWYTLIIGAILGGIVSIPFTFAAGFLFPRVQQWFDAMAKCRAFAKSAKMRKEYEEAYYFVTYPHKMTHYFINRGLEVLRLSLFAILAAGWFAVTPMKTGPGTPSLLTWIPPIFGFAFILWVISQSVNELHEIYYRVEFWGEYKNKVALDLPEIVDHGESITSSSE